LADTLPAAEGAAFRDMVERPSPLHQKHLLLKATFSERPTLLILDDLHYALREGGRLPEDIDQFLAFVLEYRAGLQVLAVSTSPIPLPPDLVGKQTCALYDHVLGGLPIHDAARLLRWLDPDNALGIHRAPECVLHGLLEPLHGTPRFIHALVGHLRQTPTLTLEDVRSDPSHVEWITEEDAESRLAGLSARELKVVQSLAIFEHPIPPSALAVLHPELGTALALSGLIARHIVEYAPGPPALVSLFPIDKLYIYKGLSQEAREELHLKAADYYRGQFVPQEERRHPTDLYHHRQAFHHLLQAGRAEEAARLLLAVGRSDLLRLGMASTTFQMVSLLLPHIRSGPQQPEVLNLLSLACQRMGDREQTIRHFREALAICDALGDRAGKALCLSNYALYLSSIGEIEDALEHQQASLALERELGNRSGEAISLGFLGLHHHDAGDHREAEVYLRRALALSRAEEDVVHEAIWWGVLGLVHHHQGETEQAVEAVRRALHIHFDQPTRQEAEASALDNLGKIYHAERDYPTALALWVAGYSLHTRTPYKEDLRRRIEQMADVWPGFRRTLERLPQMGDALLQAATERPYRVFQGLKGLPDFPRRDTT
jgi:tetratricopeptide (TPR) repeat protein